MPYYDKMAQDLAGQDAAAIAAALKSAFDDGLEAAAAPFDAREAEQFAKAGKAINNTDMQLRTGAALKAQLAARAIRALKLTGAPAAVGPSTATRTY